jgi:hypothetical protein
MRIDETGRHEATRRINRSIGLGGCAATDGRDETVRYRNPPIRDFPTLVVECGDESRRVNDEVRDDDTSLLRY